MKEMQEVLFVCTGNFYRSRFAEALFNHEAARRGLFWRAASKGFRPHLAPALIARETLEAMRERCVPREMTRRAPARLEEEDLVLASQVVMLKRTEHLPMLAADFPRWPERVTWWEIHDIDVEPATVALPKLEEAVVGLLDLLESGHAIGARAAVACEF